MCQSPVTTPPGVSRSSLFLCAFVSPSRREAKESLERQRAESEARVQALREGGRGSGKGGSGSKRVLEREHHKRERTDNSARPGKKALKLQKKKKVDPETGSVPSLPLSPPHSPPLPSLPPLSPSPTSSPVSPLTLQMCKSVELKLAKCDSGDGSGREKGPGKGVEKSRFYSTHSEDSSKASAGGKERGRERVRRRDGEWRKVRGRSGQGSPADRGVGEEGGRGEGEGGGSGSMAEAQSVPTPTPLEDTSTSLGGGRNWVDLTSDLFGESGSESDCVILSSSCSSGEEEIMNISFEAALSSMEPARGRGKGKGRLERRRKGGERGERGKGGERGERGRGGERGERGRKDKDKRRKIVGVKRKGVEGAVMEQGKAKLETRKEETPKKKSLMRRKSAGGSMKYSDSGPSSGSAGGSHSGSSKPGQLAAPGRVGNTAAGGEMEGEREGLRVVEGGLGEEERGEGSDVVGEVAEGRVGGGRREGGGRVGVPSADLVRLAMKGKVREKAEGKVGKRAPLKQPLRRPSGTGKHDKMEAEKRGSRKLSESEPAPSNPDQGSFQPNPQSLINLSAKSKNIHTYNSHPRPPPSTSVSQVQRSHQPPPTSTPTAKPTYTIFKKKEVTLTGRPEDVISCFPSSTLLLLSYSAPVLLHDEGLPPDRAAAVGEWVSHGHRRGGRGQHQVDKSSSFRHTASWL